MDEWALNFLTFEEYDVFLYNSCRGTDVSQKSTKNCHLQKIMVVLRIRSCLLRSFLKD